MKRIAVIGAGLSGLVFAHRLRDKAKVTVFEKSRGAGGRMSRRYTNEFEFDHGAQFFIARTDRFRLFLERFIEDGIVAPWHANFVDIHRSQTIGGRGWDAQFPHYVAVPGMNQLCKHLAAGLDVRLGARVSGMKSVDGGWQISTATDASNVAGQYDWVVSTVPAEQAVALLPPSFSCFEQLKEKQMAGCYALLMGLRVPLNLPWQAARVHRSDIGWISVNSSKPGRSGGFALLAHATNAWSDRHIEDDIDDVKRHMVRELSALIGHDLSNTGYCVAHRWRYANIARQSGPTMYLDKNNALAACGDWCIEGRVEAAFTSAMDLADQLDSLIH